MFLDKEKAFQKWLKKEGNSMWRQACSLPEARETFFEIFCAGWDAKLVKSVSTLTRLKNYLFGDRK